VSPDHPRLRYAVAALTDLFPGAEVGAAGAQTDPGRTFAVAPSAARPRLLVPVEPRGAAAIALRAYGGRLTRGARWGLSAAAGLFAVTGTAPLRTRLGVHSPGTSPVAGIDDHLSRALGRPVSVAVHLTPDRANRKPVVQALAADSSRPVAFAKVGVDELTAELVRREGAALPTLGERLPSSVRVPTVTHMGSLAGQPVLTLEPLPTWLPGRSPQLGDVTTAARAVAATGLGVRGPLRDSAYWADIELGVRTLPSGERARRLADCVERITDDLGDRPVTFTASHGDWTPWNMWLTDDALLVWDWERYEPATPAGLDLLHFRLNELYVRAPADLPSLADRVVADAPGVLARLGAGDADPAVSALLYLVHLGLRYERDRQADAGAAIGHLERWLLPTVEAALADLAPARGV